MYALGSYALLLLTSTAVSAQRPPTEPQLDFVDAAFTVGYRSYSTAFYRTLVRDAAALLETSRLALQEQRVPRDRVGATGTDRSPGAAAPATNEKDFAGPDVRPGVASPSQTVAPEPATLMMFGTGLVLIGAAALWRRRKRPVR